MSYRSTGCANRLTRNHNVKSTMFFRTSKLFDFFRRCRWCSVRCWWSQTGSNRRPHACKARALPTELWPRCSGQSALCAYVVGLGRLELPTSRLSSARSNQLSYKPDEASSSGLLPKWRKPRRKKEGKRRRRHGAVLSKCRSLGNSRERPRNYRSLERR